MDAVTQVPVPANEPIHTLRAGQPRTHHPRRPVERAGGRAPGPHPDHRRRTAARRRCRDRRGPAAPAQPRPRHPAQRDHGRRGRRGPSREGGGAGLARTAVRRACRGAAARRRPARRPVAVHAERRHDARPVEDGDPGRDRLRVRADRLPPLQRALRAADPRRAAGLLAGRVEPVRPPAAGGLRPRDHPVQLHRDRRQPAARARADGQHGGVEAVADAAVLGALRDAAAGGGRAAARGGEHGHRRRAGRLRGGAHRPGPGRHALHRLDRHVPAPVAVDRREHHQLPDLSRGWWARPAARISSSPTRARARTRCGPRWFAAPTSTRARSARRRRGPTCRGRSGTPACATTSSAPSSRSATATSRTSGTSAAR